MKALVAVDKNPETFVGLRYACHLLENSGAWVDALHVTPGAKDMAGESYAPFIMPDDIKGAASADVREVEKLFGETAEECRSANVGYALEVVAGDPAEEILNKAQADGHDLIVLGSQEESHLRGFLLGAVHAKILHNAQQPVLIVRKFREIRKVLVAYRGSQTDEAALKFVAPLLTNKKVELTLMHVQETGHGESDEFARTSLHQAAQILRGFDLDPITRMEKGDFVETILRDVAINRHDLVVLGAYGHKRPKYLKLISDEALNLARLTTRPILVYRETSTDG